MNEFHLSAFTQFNIHHTHIQKQSYHQCSSFTQAGSSLAFVLETDQTQPENTNKLKPPSSQSACSVAETHVTSPWERQVLDEGRECAFILKPSIMKGWKQAWTMPASFQTYLASSISKHTVEKCRSAFTKSIAALSAWPLTQQISAHNAGVHTFPLKFQLNLPAANKQNKLKLSSIYRIPKTASPTYIVFIRRWYQLLLVFCIYPFWHPNKHTTEARLCFFSMKI